MSSPAAGQLRQALATAAPTVLAFMAGSAAGVALGGFVTPASLATATGIAATTAGVAAVIAAIIRPYGMTERGNRWKSAVLVASLSMAACASVMASTKESASADRVAGVIPYSDAESYYDLMMQWPVRQMDPFNARRPVNAVLNALEGALAGCRLRDILMLRSVLLASAIAALGAAIARHAGWLAAGSSCGLLLCWSLPFAPSCLTEVSGITLSSASLALLLWASVTRSPVAIAGAAGAAGLAFTLRPGNPAFPLLLALAAGCCARRGQRRIAAIAATALCAILAIGLPRAIAWKLAEPGSETNSNMSHVILGIAAGGNWKDAERLVAMEAEGLTEAEQSQVRYRKALELARQDPSRVLSGAATGLVDSIASPSGLVEQVSWGLGLRARWLGWTAVAAISIAVAASVRRRTPLATAATLTIACFLAGAPLLWTSGKWRANATLFPGLALAVACLPLAAARNSRRATRPDVPAIPAADGAVLATGVACCIAVLPIASAAFAVLPHAASATSVDRPWVRIEFRQQPRAAGAWTSSTSASCSIRDLETWAKKRGYAQLERFVVRHGDRITGCRREPGAYILELMPGSGIAEGGESIEYVFRAYEHAPSSSQ